LEAARDLGASRRRTFLLVTLPLSRQAILAAGLVVTALPMFGDYFTDDLLSGSPRTSMVGNLVNEAISSPGQGGQAAALVLLLMVLLLAPMLAYVRTTCRAAREPAGEAVGEPRPLAGRPMAAATAAGDAGLGPPGVVDPAGDHRR
jgi:ABC-type spermidine/putrescine transport system permease subunit I